MMPKISKSFTANIIDRSGLGVDLVKVRLPQPYFWALEDTLVVWVLAVGQSDGSIYNSGNIRGPHSLNRIGGPRDICCLAPGFARIGEVYLKV